MSHGRDQTIGRVVQSLEWIADHGGTFSAPELAAVLGTCRRTAHRLLCSLEASDFVVCERPANPIHIWQWRRGRRLQT